MKRVDAAGYLLSMLRTGSTPRPGKGHAALSALTYTSFSAIPDHSIVGMSDTRVVSSPITYIQSVTIDLVISGGWNGDLYGYLSHDSGFTVLHNRVGRRFGQAAGSSGMGMDLTLADDAIENIHEAITPPAGTLPGVFKPDGRNVSPGTALDTDPVTTGFSAFNGLDANGSWTLFIADVAAGETSDPKSWTLNIEGGPEPSFPLLVMAGFLTASFRRSRLGGS